MDRKRSQQEEAVEKENDGCLISDGPVERVPMGITTSVKRKRTVFTAYVGATKKERDDDISGSVT